jgi:predicted metal-dependent enzyme (double-stranded beta helix superfamily)
MARFTSALLKPWASNLWEIATVLKAGAGEESNYRRIRRFLSDYEVGFAELGRLSARPLPQKPLYC